jgi:hypothetical protein
MSGQPTILKREHANNKNQAFNKPIKAQIEQRITRLMTKIKLLKDISTQVFVAINNFIIPECVKLKLKTITNYYKEKTTTVYIFLLNKKGMLSWNISFKRSSSN